MLSRFSLATVSFLAVVGYIGAHPKTNQSVSHLLDKRTADDYVLEVVIAIDDTMTEYYGADVDDVVKSNAWLINDIYSTSNLDQKIKVSLVEVHRMPVSVVDDAGVDGDDYGVSAQTMLTNFCNYMKEKSNVKYDAAMLITKYKLYGDDGGGINGLGNVGTMCLPESCLVLGDSFLSTSWVASHELGHVFGCQHDEDYECWQFPQANERVLMTAAVGQARKWSECSKNTFNTFFSGDQYKCLTEQQSPNLIESYKPGQNKKLWSQSRQCQEMLGDDFNVKKPYAENAKDCKQMWCPKKNGNNYSNKALFSDGTPCAKGKVCKHEQCVAESEL